MFGIPSFYLRSAVFVALPIEIIAGKFRIVRPAARSSEDTASLFPSPCSVPPPPPCRAAASLAAPLHPAAYPFLGVDARTPTPGSPFTDLRSLARAVHPPSLCASLSNRPAAPLGRSLSASALSKRGWLRPILRIRTENRSRIGAAARANTRKQGSGCLLFSLPPPSSSSSSFSPLRGDLLPARLFSRAPMSLSVADIRIPSPRCVHGQLRFLSATCQVAALLVCIRSRID